jgi:predicted restriction endonuclease
MSSDKPKKCMECGYNKHVEVCHIKSVSEFDEDSLVTEINHIDNLIGLCPTHHWEFDNKLLQIKI